MAPVLDLAFCGEAAPVVCLTLARREPPVCDDDGLPKTIDGPSGPDLREIRWPDQFGTPDNALGR